LFIRRVQKTMNRNFLHDDESEDGWVYSDFSDMIPPRIKHNDPNQTSIKLYGRERHFQNMTYEDWEDFGQDLSNNTHVKDLLFFGSFRSTQGILNEQKMSSLFRGLTGSNSIQEVSLVDNQFGVEVVRSMVPFLQNASNLKLLNVSRNNFGSEGFALLWRTLCDSPIESLRCARCGIESLEIDGDHIPKNLKELWLSNNNINTDGCRELANLLQGGESTLKVLWLGGNRIDDNGVTILESALQRNTSLEKLSLRNEMISDEGKMLLLKLVNDISSIKATLQSNHTLQEIRVGDEDTEEIQQEINEATLINEETFGDPEDAGRTKVIHMHLHSVRRAELAALQGVNRSLYSEINPLHLPEVLSLVDTYHGQKELFVALKSSVAGLISTVNRKQFLLQKRSYHEAKLNAINAEIAEIEEAESNVVDFGSEKPSNKRLRK
jgi:hypothetical protein